MECETFKDILLVTQTVEKALHQWSRFKESCAYKESSILDNILSHLLKLLSVIYRDVKKYGKASVTKEKSLSAVQYGSSEEDIV